MQLINKTRFCSTLVNNIIKEIGIDSNNADTLTLVIDSRLKRTRGLCKVTKRETGYSVRVSVNEAGNVLTLIHELRHYWQLQQFGYRFYGAAKHYDVCEYDAILFTEYMEGLGY